MNKMERCISFRTYDICAGYEVIQPAIRMLSQEVVKICDKNVPTIKRYGGVVQVFGLLLSINVASKRKTEILIVYSS